MDRVLNIATPLAANASELAEKFSSEYLAKQIQLMLKMQTENPTDAIGKAKELIESCCKTILDNEKKAWDKNWDMGKLTGETLNLLRLTPKSIPDNDPVSENFKAVLGNLRGITTKLAEIRIRMVAAKERVLLLLALIKTPSLRSVVASLSLLFCWIH
jgi:hypothetical protein